MAGKPARSGAHRPRGARLAPDQGLPTALARATGLSRGLSLLVVSGAVALALLAFVFQDARFRSRPSQVFGAIALGALIVAGWYVTGHLGYGENRRRWRRCTSRRTRARFESLSFVAPAAYSLELLMLWTDASLHPSFGIASAIGVVAGSAVHALATRSFRLEGFASVEDLRNQVVGAVLMGFGGIHGARLHGRPGHGGPVDARDRLVHRRRRHRHRLRGDAALHPGAWSARAELHRPARRSRQPTTPPTEGRGQTSADHAPTAPS